MPLPHDAAVDSQQHGGAERCSHADREQGDGAKRHIVWEHPTAQPATHSDAEPGQSDHQAPVPGGVGLDGGAPAAAHPKIEGPHQA